VNNGFQQTQQAVTSQMPPNPQYPQQPMPGYPPQQPSATTTSAWNPFSTSATSLPPARATPPPSLPKY
jgi:hypothetical protein